MLETQRDGLQNNRKQDVQLLLEHLAIGYGTPSFQTCLYEPISVYGKWREEEVLKWT